jgi:hypothetical protein
LRLPGDVESLLATVLPSASERKLRLFACACARCYWYDFEHPRSRQAIEAAERHADGLVDEREYRIAAQSAAAVARAVRWSDTPEWEAVGRVYLLRSLARDASQWNVRASVLQAVRSATSLAYFEARGAAGGTKPLWSPESLQGALCQRFRDVFGPCEPPDAAVLAWNDQAVRHVARAVYDEGDFARLPILADALEDAGCADAELLAHCRGPGPHVRGCWAVDAILARS